MKYLLLSFFVLISSLAHSQKYILIDKKITQPVTYTNTVTIEHRLKNLFPVEKDKITQFIAEVEKISEMLSPKKKVESFDLFIGETRFVGVKIPLLKEERLDVVLTSNIGGTKISNASNAFFINTWVKYIKGYVK